MFKFLTVLFILYSGLTFAQQESRLELPSRFNLEKQRFDSISSGEGFGVGNGGDFVRANFIKYGQNIVNYLKYELEGQSFSKKYKLDTKKLELVLNNDVIKVSDRKLIDNTGEEVDAIFLNNQLFLYDESWEDFFSSNNNFLTLIFHEMLRAIRKNDDDFRISRHLNIPQDYSYGHDDSDKSFLDPERSVECSNNSLIYEFVFSNNNMKSNFWTKSGSLISGLNYANSDIAHGVAIADYDFNSKIFLMNVRMITTRDRDYLHNIMAYVPDYKSQEGFEFKAWLSATPAMMVDKKLEDYIQENNVNLNLNCKLL
jgi:hypothetical protein